MTIDPEKLREACVGHVVNGGPEFKAQSDKVYLWAQSLKGYSDRHAIALLLCWMFSEGRSFERNLSRRQPQQCARFGERCCKWPGGGEREGR